MITDRLYSKFQKKEQGEGKMQKPKKTFKKGRGRPPKEIKVEFKKAIEEVESGEVEKKNFLGGKLSERSISKGKIASLLKVASSATALLLVIFSIVFLFPLDFKNLNFLVPYVLPFIFFLLALFLGLRNFFEEKIIFYKSILNFGVLLLSLYFLFFIPFLGRDLFSYVFLKPLIYVLAVLSFFLIQNAFTFSKKIKKGLMVAIVGVTILVFLVTNPTLRSFYNDTFNLGIREIPTLSLKHSWEIGVETIKRKPLFGVGPGNYENAFTQYRPLSFNQTENWNLRFGLAGNLFFQILTTGGLLGFVIFCFLFFWSIRKFPFKKEPVLGVFYALALILVLFFIPFSLPLLFLFFLLLAIFFIESEKEQFVISGGPVLAIILVVLAVLFLVAEFFVIKLTLADYYYQKAQEAKLENDGTDTYQYLQKAIQKNPQSELYHRDYAQVNLLLANFIASQGELNDVEKDRVQKLLQQAVRESGVITDQINTSSAANWEIRAQIYRNLIGVIENADQWAVSAYIQAIGLDPLNPSLKVELGGIYYRLESYEDAKVLFQDAIRIKSDYANAYYNLAHNYKAQNNLQGAIIMLTRALELIDESSSDYEKGKNELTEWQKETGVDTSTNQEQQGQSDLLESTKSAQPSEATASAQP